MKKRILSIVLTIIMLLSVIPLPALAAEQSEPVNLGSTAFARMCKGTCPSGEGIQNVFDGDRSTKWCMFGSGWMFFTLPDPALIQYMRICHAGSNPTETAPYNTVAFDLEVLDESKLSEESMREAQYRRSLIENDGLWTKVASVTGNGADITNTVVSMTESRTMFRLNVTDAGEDDTVRIYEVELFDTVPDRFEVHMDSAQASVDGKPVTSARPGEIVTVTADNAGSPDQYFHQWETSPENLVLSAPFSDVTTFIMPESDVTLKAHYSTDNTMYNIIVDNGTANVHGTPVTAAPRGVDVTLIADDAPEGQAFDHWESVDPSVFISYDYSPVVTIKMTCYDLHLKPVYKDAITQVSISDLTLPKRGANPDFEVTIPQDAPYHLATSQELSDHGYFGEALMFSQNGISWRERVWERYLAEGDVFDNAREGAYYAQISVLPNEGYTFAENVAVTINDSDSLIGKVQFKRNMLSVDTKPLTADLADPTERAVTVEGGTATVYGETVTTAPGGVTVHLIADPAPEGQVFSYWEVVGDNIIVNATPSAYFLMPTEAVHVRAVYGQPIQSVSVSDLTLPVLAAHPDYEVTIPQDAPYHLATPQELKRYVGDGYPMENNYHGVWWFENGNSLALTPESTFYDSAPGQYYARILLAPNEGYAFTSETTAVINGGSPQKVMGDPKYAAIASTTPLTAAPGPVMDYAVDVERGIASVDGTAVTSARVGSTVTLTADPAPDGQIFDHWEVTSGHVKLARPRDPSVTFTMYAEDFQAKAVFMNIIEKVSILDLTMPVLGEHPDYEVTLPPDVPYHLATPQELDSLRSRDAKHYYHSVRWQFDEPSVYLTPDSVFDRPDVTDYRAEIALVANEGCIFPEDGFVGSKVMQATINGGTSLVYGIGLGRHLITINTIAVSAAPAPVKEYAITVENGTASVDGTTVTSALADAAVTLAADPAPEGMIFDHWEVTSGVITLADSKAVSTTFTMPAAPVQVKAVYQSTTIRSVSISDLTQPALGEHPDFEVTLPEDAPYHLATLQELKDAEYTNYETAINGMWWKCNDGSAMTPDMTFGNASENAYHAQIVLVPNDGYHFDKNTTVTINGDTEHPLTAPMFDNFLNVLTPTTTVAPDPVPEYTITVEGGIAHMADTAAPTAPAGSTVTLTADPAPDGQIFDHWEVISGEIALTDAGAASTTFTMPAGPVHVKAVYAHDYTITVESGTASVAGTAVTAAFAGDTVTLSAAPAPEGKIFDRWEVVSGGITLTDARAASTVFTMPAAAVQVKAVYKDAPRSWSPSSRSLSSRVSSARTSSSARFPWTARLRLPPPPVSSSLPTSTGSVKTRPSRSVAMKTSPTTRL